MKKIIQLVLLVMLCPVVYAQSDLNGFRNFTWDTPFTQMSEGMVKSKSITPGYESYEKTGDNLLFEGLTSRSILYLFKKGLFKGVTIGLYNKDVDVAVQKLTKKYGEPKYTETPFLKNWEWHLNSAIIALSFFPTNKNDESAAIGIRKP